MCDTDRRQYGDPLSLLKNCDAAALGKLCDAVTSMRDDPVAYANFPKRSLVKCFSARDKYEWHLNRTAELENLQKQWSVYKQRARRRPRRTLEAQDIIHEENKQETPESVVECRSLSPFVNEDILREALMVAEHFAADDSDVPSTLSSDQKPLENCPPMEAVEKPTPSKITTPMRRQSSHIFPETPSYTLSSTRSRIDDRKADRQKSPLAPQIRGRNAAPRRGIKGATTPGKTPRNKAKGRASPLRGAFGGCLGSKHASADFTSPRRKEVSSQRHASTGPARRLFANRLKASKSCRLEREQSIGSVRLRSAWK